MRTGIRFVLAALLMFVASFPATSAESSSREVYTFKRGVIVNHWLADNLPASMMRDAHYGADWFDREDVAWIADQGFDHLRIWVSGHEWVDASGNLVDDKIAPFERALRDARAEGLGVVLAMHSLPRYRATVRGEPEPANAGSPFSDPEVRSEAERLWRRVAQRFSGYDRQLRFELINQPDAEDGRQMRVFNAAMLKAVRRYDTKRIVYIGGHGHGIEAIDDVVLSDANTALSISFREPQVFAYQYQERIPKIAFPGRVPELGRILEDGHPWLAHSNLELTTAWLDARIGDMVSRARAVAGRHEIYVSNVGVMTARVDSDSVRDYMRAVRTGLEREGLGWAVYDYHTGCAIRANRGTGGPTAVLEGLDLKREARKPDENTGRAAFSYRHGVVVTHWLGLVAPNYLGHSGVPHTYAATWFDREDLVWIRHHGFDHVRITVDADQWPLLLGRLPEDRIAPLIRALGIADELGLGVVMRFAEHPFRRRDAGYSAERARRTLAAQWRAIAERFSSIGGDGLRYEIGAGDLQEGEAPGPRFREYLAGIRDFDRKRFVYVPMVVPEEAYSPVDEVPRHLAPRALDAQELDRYDGRVGLSLSYWEPAIFTEQSPGQSVPVPFPGIVPDAAGMKQSESYLAAMQAARGARLDSATVERGLRAWAEWNRRQAIGRTLYLGDFGGPYLADDTGGELGASNRRYLSAVVEAANALEIGWAVYDYESGRNMRDARGDATSGYEGLGLEKAQDVGVESR